MTKLNKILTAMALVAVVGFVASSVPTMAAGGDGQPSAKSGETSSAPAAKAPKAPRATKKAPEGKVSLNSASLAQLQTLPRVGAKMAQRILDYRAANKGFKTVEELRNVKGIGPKVFENLKPFLAL